MPLRVILAAIGFVVAMPLNAGVLAISDWQNPADGVDGWTFEADGTNFMRVASGGNPGGFLQVSDLGSGGVIFFDAPIQIPVKPKRRIRGHFVLRSPAVRRRPAISRGHTRGDTHRKRNYTPVRPAE